MRTLTTQETQVHTLRNRAVRMRVRVDSDGAGTFQDLTSLDSYDWVLSAKWGDQVDQQVATATVQLIREQYSLSLAPLRSGSKYNATTVMVQVGREIRIETATLPMDSTVDSTDWRLVFQGYIDSISFGGSDAAMTLQCRDRAALLADRFIENQTIYSGAMEDVIQDILDDWVNDSAGDPFTLEVPTSPSFVVNEYLQDIMSAQEAVQRLADLIGWTLKFRYDSGSSEFQLTLVDPGRGKSAMGTITVSGQPTAGQSHTINGQTITARASGAVTNEYNIGTTFNATAANLSNAINASAQAANVVATYGSATYAQGTITFSAPPASGGTVTIGATTFTAVSGMASYYGRFGSTNFAIAPTLIETVTNLKVAINAHATAGAAFRAIQQGTNILIEFRTIGTAGNSQTFTESMSNMTIDGGGTLGGTQTAVNATVRVQWRARGTAGNAIEFIETGAGVSNMTIDGAGVLGGTVAGTDISSVYTFDQDDYYDVSVLDISRLQVRNYIRVIFSDTAYLGNRTTVDVYDQDSITKYGRRFMGVTEASTSPIDTPLEALAMANALLDDLKEPEAEQAIVVDYFYACELGDYYTFTANKIHYDADQNFAVVAFDHTVDREKAITTLSVRGTPSSGTKRWLGLEGRTGVAPASDLVAPDEQIVNITPAAGGLVLSYDAPAEKDWATTEVYLSTSSIAATVYPEKPDASLLVATGRQSTFYLGGLTPGETYHGRIILLDSYGNFTGSSSFITMAAEASASFHEKVSNNKTSLIKNGEFNTYTKGDVYPPDGWKVNTSNSATWAPSGVNRIYFDTTQTHTGDRSIIIEANGTQQTILNQEDQTNPISANDIYILSVVAKFDSATAGTLAFNIGTFEDDGVTPVSGYGFVGDSNTTSFTEFKSQAFRLGATERFFQATVSYTGDSSGDIAYIDRMALVRASPNISRHDTTNQDLTNATPHRIEFDTANTDDIGYIYDSSAETCEIEFPGLYQFSCMCIIDDNGGTDDWQGFLEIVHDSISAAAVTIAQAYGQTSQQSGTSRGSVTVISPWIEMSAGDIVYAQLTPAGAGGDPRIERSELIGKCIQRTSL